MVGFLGGLRRAVFRISPREVTFAHRGFRRTSPQTRSRLERIGTVFLEGYHRALDTRRVEDLPARLDETTPEERGWAYEGAAMALGLRDRFSLLGNHRLPRFLELANHHTYMVHIGAGWVVARLRLDLELYASRFDPLLGALLADGYGFHEGYFQAERTIHEQVRPRTLSPAMQRVFDQGVGRSLWFVEGADVTHVRDSIATFPVSRQEDLWSGTGLACAYAGDGSEDPERAVVELLEACGPHRAGVAQGMSFAAKARERAGNPAPQTEVACQIAWGLSAADAAQITDAALPDDGDYSEWRGKIRMLYSLLNEGVLR